MKLILIMSVAEYTDELRKLLFLHQVPIFSELDMKGVKMDSRPGDRENWFGHAKLPAFSNLILAAVDDGKARELMNALDDYSKKSHPTAPIHALQLSVDEFA